MPAGATPAAAAAAPQQTTSLRRRLVGKQALATPAAATAAPQQTTSVRRRLVGKQALPTQQTAIDDSALAVEAWTEVTVLSADAQRQHVHYTHVRTSNPADRQLDTFTRKEFWEHLAKTELN